MVRRISLLIFLLMLSGCNPSAPLTVDSSSNSAYESSLKRISHALSIEERQAFSHAIMVLGTQRIPNETFDESSQRFLRRIHGKTFSQIIAEANDVEQASHLSEMNKI